MPSDGPDGVRHRGGASPFSGSCLNAGTRRRCQAKGPKARKRGLTVAKRRKGRPSRVRRDRCNGGELRDGVICWHGRSLGRPKESRMDLQILLPSKTLIWGAWFTMLANQVVAGITRRRSSDSRRSIAAHLSKLLNADEFPALHSAAGKGSASPKKSGGVRVVGRPYVSEHICAYAVRCGLEPRLIRSVHRDPYGYRRENRRWRRLPSLDAVCWHQDWFVEILHPRALRQSRSRPS